jgi:protein-arginine kinase activator protein McsA
MAKSVLQETGFTPQSNDIDLGNTLSSSESIESLEEELQRCEENENYERAAEIMKEIERLKKNKN